MHLSVLLQQRRVQEDALHAHHMGVVVNSSVVGLHFMAARLLKNALLFGSA